MQPIHGSTSAVKSQHLLETLLRHSPAVLYTLTIDGGKVQTTIVSDGIERILGANPKDATSEWWHNSLHPDDRAQIASRLDELEKTGEIFSEYRLRHQNGSYRWVEDHLRLVDSNESHRMTVVGVLIDITERKKSEAKMKALLTLGQKISAVKTEKEAAEVILAVADQLFGWDACSLDLYCSDSGLTQNILTKDTFNGQRAECAPGIDNAPPSLLMAKVIDTEAQLYLDNNRPAHDESCVAFGDTARRSAAIMMVPVRNGDDIIGVFSIHSYRYGAYTLDDLAIFQSLADHCTGALNRLREERLKKEMAQRLEAMLQSTSEAIYEIDLNGDCQFVNRAGCDLVGYSDDELIGRNMHGLLHHHHPDGSIYELADCPIASTVKSGSHSSVATEVFWRKDGTPITVEYSCNPVVLNGSITGSVITFRDVSERKRLEAELQVRERRLNSFFTNATAGLCILDSNFRYVRINDALALLNGLTVEQHLGKSIREVLPTLANIIEPMLLEVLRTGIAKLNLNIRVTLPSGPVHVIASYFPIADDFGNNAAIGCTVLDITELRRKEEELRESETKFRQLAETINGVFWIRDVQQGIIYISPAYDTIWGRSREDIARSPMAWADAIHPEDRDRVVHAAKTKQLVGKYDETYRIIQPTGKVRWIHDRAFVFMVDQQAKRIVGLAEDITERKELEAQLRQSHKLDSIGQLAGGIAHDFNNILTVIQCHAALLADDTSLSQSVIESIKEIGEAATSASNLTRQLLTFSRRQMMQSKPINLSDTVNGVAKMLRRTLGEHIALVLQTSNGATIVGDPGMMEQVIMNLALNARDAMPKGGTLTISTVVKEVDESFRLQHPKASAGNVIWLSVADTGCGIPPEHMDRIFDPFFTTKEVGRGTGLGLATVYGIVQQHGGWITVTSDTNRGTRFDIYLPYSAPPASVLPNGSSSKPISGKGKILVVEDDPEVRNLVRGVLTRSGYTVVTSDCGQVALVEFQNHFGTIDLVLTDLVMPGELSGRELGERLKAKDRNLPVIYMSGYSSEALDESFRLHAESNFIQKPFTPAKLCDCVHRALARKSENTLQDHGNN